eukprot:jgi/Bigna1/79483/fgenesh1_pg.62_\
MSQSYIPGRSAASGRTGLCSPHNANQRALGSAYLCPQPLVIQSMAGGHGDDGEGVDSPTAVSRTQKVNRKKIQSPSELPLPNQQPRTHPSPPRGSPSSSPPDSSCCSAAISPGALFTRIGTSALCLWLPIGVSTMRLLNGDVSLSEDVLDLIHATFTTTSSMFLMTKFTSRRFIDEKKIDFETVEPYADNHGTMVISNVVKFNDAFLTMSTGFFFADLVHIFHQVVLKKNTRLHQWRERVLHHVLQFAANVPTLMSSRSTAQGMAMRTYLTQGYLAEGSDIFLRIGNIMRRFGLNKTNPILVKRNWYGLLLSFFVCRIVNFYFAMKKMLNAQKILPKNVARLHLVGQFIGSPAGVDERECAVHGYEVLIYTTGSKVAKKDVVKQALLFIMNSEGGMWRGNHRCNFECKKDLATLYYYDIIKTGRLIYYCFEHFALVTGSIWRINVKNPPVYNHFFWLFPTATHITIPYVSGQQIQYP